MEVKKMNRIEALRTALGISQKQLADTLGVRQTAVSKWEKDRTAPDFHTIMCLCTIFDVSAEFLMGYNSQSLTANEYQALAMRTANTQECKWLENVGLGLAGEAGECADLIKKHVIHHHDLDKHHLAVELGDALWYIALGATCLGYPLEEIARMNNRKLQKRYPEGFDPERSKNREADDV